MIRKSVNKNVLRTAIEVAAEEAYKDEVIDTDMERHIIGIEKQFPDKAAWMEDRIEDWISQAQKRIGYAS